MSNINRDLQYLGTQYKNLNLQYHRLYNFVQQNSGETITYNVFNRETNGLVPMATGSTTTRFLREDGTWVVPTNTTYTNGTSAILTTGTSTTSQLWSAKVLVDYIKTSLPISSTSLLGGVIVGNGLSVDATGKVAVSYGTVANTSVQGNDSRLHTHSNKAFLDSIDSTLLSNWNSAYSWGNHNDAGYLKTITANDVLNALKSPSEGVIDEIKTILGIV